MRKKDRIFTYAATAFVIYNSAGCPKTKDFANSLSNTNNEFNQNLIKDIEAVNMALDNISKLARGDEIKNAVLKIYRYNLNNLGARIRRYSVESYNDVRTIYRWLSIAREEFARCRGLDNTKMK